MADERPGYTGRWGQIKAAKETDRGNEQLKRAIEAYADGNDERAASHYEKALDKYDDALDILDA